MYLQDTDELILLFGNIQAEGFYDLVKLTDTKIGFSIQKDYPSNIRYKPAKTESGIPDNVAVIWVVYESAATDQKRRLIPIRLRVALMSKYRARHWDYEWNDPNCPTPESVKLSLSSPQPLELTLTSDLFFDSEANTLVNAKGKEVEGKAVLLKLYAEHCETVHPFKGMKHRTTLKAHHYFRKSCDIGVDVCKWLLLHIFGRRLIERPDRMTYFHGYTTEDCKKLDLESIVIGGYKATKPVVILYVLLAIFLCWLLLPVEKNTYLSDVISSDFLIVIHSLFLLVILDLFLPRSVFHFLNVIIWVRKEFLDYLLRRSGRI